MKDATALSEPSAQPLLTILGDRHNAEDREMLCSSMDMPSTQTAPARREEPDLNTLLVRVSAEFHEMPGLRLTLPQAARLFAIDVSRCERVLRLLCERRVLATDGHTFARADGGARRA